MQKRSCLLLIMILFLLAAPPAMFAASVQLSWQPNAEPDLQEYNVYYGTQSRSYGPPIPVDKSATYTLSDLDEGMVYYFSVSAVDNNGNESGFSEEISKTIASSNTQPPTVTITSPVDENTYTTGSPTIAIAGTASDDQGLQQVTWTSSTGGSGAASGTTNWSINTINLTAGANVITVTATDSAGNTAQDSLTVNYTATVTVSGLPVVSVTSSSNDGNIAANTIDNNLSTRWSASGSGQWIQYDLGSFYTISSASIAFYRGDTRTSEFEIFVSDDAGSWNSVFRGNSSGATLQQESFSISNATGRFVRIVGYGNSSNAWNSITEVDILGVPAIPPDTTAPVLDILSPTNADTYETSTPPVQLTGTAADDSGVVEVTWSNSNGDSGAASGTTNWSTSDIGLLEGINTITVTAKDAAGNQGTSTLTVVYTAPDTIAPTVTITSPVDENTYTTGSPTIAIAGTASDDQGLQQVTWTSSTGGSGAASGTTNWSINTINLTAGANVITVTATDSAGNTAQDSLTVNYTATVTVSGLPVVSVTSSSNDGNIAANTIDNNLSTRWSASGSGQWIQYDLGSFYTISSASIAFYRGDTRTSEFEIFVSDDAGSWNSVFRGNSSGATLQQESFSISNATGRFVRIVGYGNSSNAWNSITEVDILGVPAIPPDTTAPVLDILSPTNADTYETSTPLVQLTGTAADDSGVVEVTWSNSNGDSGAASGTTNWSTSDIGLLEGINTITVTAKDAAGNENIATLTAIFTPQEALIPIVHISTSSNDGNSGNNTVDNDLSSRWSAKGSGQWIQYDLGASYKTTQLQIAFYKGNSRTAEFEIQVSEDANSWTSGSHQVSSGTTLEQENYAMTGETGRYVRIVGYGNSANTWNSITEVDILGMKVLE